MIQLAPPALRLLDRPSRRAFGAPQDEAEGGSRLQRDESLRAPCLPCPAL